MKKKYCKKVFSFMFLCGFALMVGGCYFSVNKPEETGGNTATVEIKTTSANSRAVAIPNLVSQIKSYTVTISGGINPPPAANFNVGEPIIFTGVRIANGYAVTVTAHSAEKTLQTATTILGNGSASFNVTAANTQVNVTVATGCTQGGGKGTVDLVIRYPKTENVLRVNATLTGPGTSSNSFNATVDAATGTETYDASRITTAPIQSGWYNMTLVFDRGSGKAKTGLSEVVYVYDNGVTDRWVVDSAGTYDMIRTYDNVFQSQYAYLANIKFNTTGITLTDPGDLNLIPLPYFISERTTDTNRYIVHCSANTFQFLPVAGKDGQTIKYAWKTGTGSEDSEVEDKDLSDISGISRAIQAETGNLYIQVTAPDSRTKTTYRIQVIKDFKLIYDSNGATSGSPPDPKTYKYGDIPQLLGNVNNLAKTGYVFSGWNTKADGSGSTYFAGNYLLPITGSVTLYAKWQTSNLQFSVTAVNPATAVLNFNTPDSTVIHKALGDPKYLTVNLGQNGITYKQNSTMWSYTGSDGIKRLITTAANTAGDKDSSLIWQPPTLLLPGDYTFSVLAVVIVNGVETACTGYFTVTIAL